MLIGNAHSPASSRRAISAFKSVISESAALFVGFRSFTFVPADVSSMVTSKSTLVFLVPHGLLEQLYNSMMALAFVIRGAGSETYQNP